MQSLSYLVVYLFAVWHFKGKNATFKKSESTDFVFDSVHSSETNVVLGIEVLKQRTVVNLSTPKNLASC